MFVKMSGEMILSDLWATRKQKVNRVDPWPVDAREIWRGRSQKPWGTFSPLSIGTIQDVFLSFKSLGCEVRGIFMCPDAWDVFRDAVGSEIYFNWDVGFSRDGLGGHLLGVPIVIGPRIPKGRAWFIGDLLQKQVRNVVRRPCMVLCI